MTNPSDIIRSLIAYLQGIVDAPWGTRVYPQGRDVAALTAPFIIVGCQVERPEHVQIPDTRRVKVYQVTITCAAEFDRSGDTGIYNKHTLTGRVLDELSKTELIIYDYTTDPENRTEIDRRDLRRAEITDLVFEDVADLYSQSSLEIVGYIDVYQPKST